MGGNRAAMETCVPIESGPRESLSSKHPDVIEASLGKMKVASQKYNLTELLKPTKEFLFATYDRLREEEIT